MSLSASPQVNPPLSTYPAPDWPSAQREAAFKAWLMPLCTAHGLQPQTLRLASADASFRRYLRLDGDQHSYIVMDAPPDKEDCRPFVQVAALMAQAGLNVPRILDWDQANGFLLLGDLGQQTLLALIQSRSAVEFTASPEAAFWLRPAPDAEIEALFRQASDQLLRWQLASKPDVLPSYDAALLRRELALFPDWYLTHHRGLDLQAPAQHKLSTVLAQAFDVIVTTNLAAPQVFVHRDFMPRNLMVPIAPGAPLGVLDFQDAVYGPVTYDIACLMRDAFLSWDESFVIDVTVRYWEKARKAGLLDFDGWSQNFGDFYRAVEWMGLQRHLKVAGIFARLSMRDGKAHYLADAPRFIGYIRNTAARYRELTPLLRALDQVEGLSSQGGFGFGRAPGVVG